MKRFILEVPEDEEITPCVQCPWDMHENICKYCCENNICTRYNFAKANLSEDENKNSIL